MGICYLLGSKDLHYENVIAHGEYPVIIDLEMGVGAQEGAGSVGIGIGVENDICCMLASFSTNEMEKPLLPGSSIMPEKQQNVLFL